MMCFPGSAGIDHFLVLELRKLIVSFRVVFLSIILSKVELINLCFNHFPNTRKHSLKKISEYINDDFLPENSRLHYHFWSDFLNFDARSILPT